MTDPAAELARLVEEVSGNVVPEAHREFLARAAAARVSATGHATLAAYVEALRRGALADEWGRLLPLVTVNESYLFRTPQHFAALVTTLLPRLLAARSSERRLRLWSAGCARGEEPATLAMILAERPELVVWDWRILASDVDEEALDAARRGAYAGRAIAGVPPELRRRYLAGGGEAATLAPALLARIDYRAINLVHEPFVDPGGPFDVIFLRNVLIYFRVESQRRVAAAVAATLAPDGYLFLGPAETLWQISEELEPVDLGDCFCYRRKNTLPSTAGSGLRAPGSGRKAGSGLRAQGSVKDPSAASGPPDPGPPGSRSKRRATQTLPASPPPERGARSPEPGARGTQERLAEAVDLLLSDRIEEATALIQQALAADPADVEAHALEGFVHDISARTEPAIASFRAALYLDHTCYQVHLLLADALRRQGWSDRARTSYRAVLDLLAGGAGHELAALTALPLPDRAAAAQRARAALSTRS